MMRRRTFLKASLAASALAASGVSCASGPGARPPAPRPKLKILVLGGTGFLGPRSSRRR